MEKKYAPKKVIINGAIVKIKGSKLVVKPKLSFSRILVYAGVSLGVLVSLAASVILTYPIIHSYFSKKENVLPIQTNPPTEFSIEVETDKNGTFVENQASKEEVENSKKFLLDEHILPDLQIFDSNFTNVDGVKAIYLHKIFNDKTTIARLDNEELVGVVDILFRANGENYMLEYHALKEDFPAGISEEKGLNIAGQLNAISEILTKCYPYEIFLCQNLSPEDFICNSIYYNEKDVFKVPVYSGDQITYYSISRADLSRMSFDVSCESAFNQFLKILESENKEPFQSDEPIKGSFYPDTADALHSDTALTK